MWPPTRSGGHLGGDLAGQAERRLADLAGIGIAIEAVILGRATACPDAPREGGTLIATVRFSRRSEARRTFRPRGSVPFPSCRERFFFIAPCRHPYVLPHIKADHHYPAVIRIYGGDGLSIIGRLD
jgi:hypothetical protein